MQMFSIYKFNFNSRQTDGKHDSIAVLNIFKNIYNKTSSILHQGEFHTGCNMTISITSHIHTAALSSVVLGVIALSQRTKHNSQPLKIHYKKLLHNFFCSLFFSSFLHYIYIIKLQWWIFWQKTWRMQSKYTTVLWE